MTLIHRVGAGSARYVFVHGTPSDARVWDAVVQRLPAGQGAVVVDLPDHGGAADVPDADPALVENSLIAALEALPGRLVLVGHSYGAYLAARVAAKLEARVERLLLVSGFARMPDEIAQAYRELAAGLDSGAVSLETLVEVGVSRWYGAECSPADRAVVSAIVGTTGRARAVRLLERLARTTEPCFHVTSYAQPALALHARDDAAVPCSLGQELAGRGLHATLELVDAHQHMLPLTHAELVAARAFTD